MFFSDFLTLDDLYSLSLIHIIIFCFKKMWSFKYAEIYLPTKKKDKLIYSGVSIVIAISYILL